MPEKKERKQASSFTPLLEKKKKRNDAIFYESLLKKKKSDGGDGGEDGQGALFAFEQIAAQSGMTGMFDICLFLIESAIIHYISLSLFCFFFLCSLGY